MTEPTAANEPTEVPTDPHIVGVEHPDPHIVGSDVTPEAVPPADTEADTEANTPAELGGQSVELEADPGAEHPIAAALADKAEADTEA